jgi:hypothetical protein
VVVQLLLPRKSRFVFGNGEQGRKPGMQIRRDVRNVDGPGFQCAHNLKQIGMSGWIH